ncbi:ABC transporter substrate-binding protein [Xylophilus sp. GOD-11R]|uniref:ABC transporter substrate-binding protein n=1 Tax=Xylophilus sp. GOD-11R TaxID=3089814 RepID=UPI00298C3825|nr:extracellular solute-binding protein [Xylophilus sp. GOD-11R]WPB55594.1 extracellular solute-binding protein [Xylophilus sp. GOD-11R]
MSQHPFTRRSFTASLIAGATGFGAASARAQTDVKAQYTGADMDWKQATGQTIVVGGANHPWSNALLPLLPQFTELTGIKVTTDFRSETEFLTALPIKLAGGSPNPDVFMYLSYGQGINAGWLEPLNAYYGDKNLVDMAWYDEADLLKTAREYPVWHNKERYAFAITSEAQTMFYNTQMLQAKGLAVPQTFDELLAATRAMKAGTTSGIAMRAKAAGNALFPLTGFIFSHGGQLMENGRVVFDSPEAVAGVEMFTRLLRENGPVGVSNYDWYEALGDFMQGATASSSDSSNFATDIANPQKSKVAAQTTFALFPHLPGKKSLPNMSHWQAAINAKSKAKKASFLFMAWATSKPTALQMAAQGLATTRVSAWSSDAFKKAFGAQAAEAALGNLQAADADLAKRARFHPQAPQILNALAIGMSETLTGADKAQVALTRAAAKANAAIRT